MRDATTRRMFLGSTGVLAVSSRLGSAAPTGSERIRLAVIGLRGRGSDLVRLFAANPEAEVVAICDVDDAMFAKPLRALESAKKRAPRTEKDFRRLLDDRAIDAVAIATPDHWHGLMTVLACQAGKDVYVEKPASYNVVEGRKMVEAARKYDRVVQVGTQRRSTPHIQDAVAHVRSGALGKVGMIRTWCHQKRVNIGHGRPGPVPTGLDYALWQGPAPDRPYIENHLHYKWHWFWNWGTGELGNNGVHALDMARWALGSDAPRTVCSGGGKYVFDDDQETPDTQVVTWDFLSTCLVYEHRVWSKHGTEGSGFGTAFYGEKGTLIIDSKGWHVEDGEAAGGPSTDGQTAHVQNFLECIKTRAHPRADIEDGHLSARLCHLGNIAFRVGRKLTFDAATESFHDSEADRLLAREYSSRFEMPSQV